MSAAGGGRGGGRAGGSTEGTAPDDPESGTGLVGATPPDGIVPRSTSPLHATKRALPAKRTTSFRVRSRVRALFHRGPSGCARRTRRADARRGTDARDRARRRRHLFTAVPRHG